MNKTPRTNEKTYAPDTGEFAFVDASFARQLETELAEALETSAVRSRIVNKQMLELEEARAEIERMSAKIGRLSRRMQSDASGYFEGSERLNSELEKTQAEIERLKGAELMDKILVKQLAEQIEHKNELIEQMREALQTSLKYAKAHAVRTEDKHVIKDVAQINSALEAAGRGR